jgi:hypothetical protein
MDRVLRPRRWQDWIPFGVFLLLSVQLHIVAITLFVMLHLMDYLGHPLIHDGTVMELVPLPADRLTSRSPDDATEDAEEDEPEPEREKEPEGQIVEIPPPQDQTRPDEAKFLAEYNSKVDVETRSERFKINPEVLAPTYSDEAKIQQKAADVPDLHMDKPSTGATVGNAERFDPDRDGMLGRLPGKWNFTNQAGDEDPVPSSSTMSVLAGAPQNDRLDVKRGTSTALNSKEFKYASYLLRIRRLVNFYWNQNLENLPSSVRLARPEYTTRVSAILDGNGVLETVDVTAESGSPELDDCVIRAFKVAGPYSNPPVGLVEKDGRIYLPDMGFSVVLGMAQMRYEGIDPRAGVQFPGILKSPR